MTEFKYKRLFHITLLSKWLPCFERYTSTYSKKNIKNRKFEGIFLLASEQDVNLVLNKVKDTFKKYGEPGDKIIKIEVELDRINVKDVFKNEITGTGVGWYIRSDDIPIKQTFILNDDNNFTQLSVEDLSAQAFKIKSDLDYSWQECSPRSFSILPIAKACNANCAFCFSKSSVSSLIVNKKEIELLPKYAEYAKTLGAERAVITGGGEPTLIGRHQLLKIVQDLNKSYKKILLITNGYIFDKLLTENKLEELDLLIDDLKKSGLTNLAISRHGYNQESDKKILGIDVKTSDIFKKVKSSGINVRSIAVIQKGGLDNSDKVQQYIDRCFNDKVYEICFKELYVSSIIENNMASKLENQYSKKNHIDFNIVLDVLKSLEFKKTSELPWGSPVYTGFYKGNLMSIACYTEPSVGWERSNGVVRSWNFMSDGKCLASLEDYSSEVLID